MTPEKVSMIFGIVFGSIGLFFFIRFIILKIIRRVVVKKDTLSFFEQYIYHDSYSDEDRMRPRYLPKILDIFRRSVKCNGSVSIESRFNNINYAVFDLDNIEQLKLFKKIYSATPYAIFVSSYEQFVSTSSQNNYWAFVDYPYSNIRKIFNEPNWKVCNDHNYVSFCMHHKKVLVRGIYEDNSRKPHQYEINGNLSKNFQLFIDKLDTYYNKDGLELSVLRYKDPTMLIKFNRRRKLQQLKDLEKCLIK